MPEYHSNGAYLLPLSIDVIYDYAGDITYADAMLIRRAPRGARATPLPHALYAAIYAASNYLLGASAAPFRDKRFYTANLAKRLSTRHAARHRHALGHACLKLIVEIIMKAAFTAT